MLQFMKEHVAVRCVLIALFFVLGIALILMGWSLTGQLAGLGLMILGIASLLAAMWIYNIRFTEPSR